MNTITLELLKDGSDVVKHLGNHVYARTADLVSVYEVLTYKDYAPELLKDLNTTFIITSNIKTWDDVADRFLGTPTAPDFTKVIA